MFPNTGGWSTKRIISPHNFSAIYSCRFLKSSNQPILACGKLTSESSDEWNATAFIYALIGKGFEFIRLIKIQVYKAFFDIRYHGWPHSNDLFTFSISFSSILSLDTWNSLANPACLSVSSIYFKISHFWWIHLIHFLIFHRP